MMMACAAAAAADGGRGGGEGCGYPPANQRAPSPLLLDTAQLITLR